MHRHSFINRILVLTLFCFGLSSFAGDKEFYNEVFDEDGMVRPQYALPLDQVLRMSDTAANQFVRRTKKKISGDTPIAPIPRVLTKAEYKELKKGVKQRAKAIRAFLEDHYDGKKKYLKKGIIPEEIIQQIIERSGEMAYQGKLPKYFPFRGLYGPDIIRAINPKTGEPEWLVLEDNLGFVGGSPGDTIPTREVFEAELPFLTSRMGVLNMPHDFLTELMDQFQKMASPKIGFHNHEGVIVMLSSPPYGDKEDVRMAEEFKKRGVILVTPNTKVAFNKEKVKNRKTSKSLVVRDDGVYLQERTKYGYDMPEKKVGLLMLNAEHTWTDWKSPLAYEKALLEEAKDYIDEKGVKLRKVKYDEDGELETHRDGTKEETKEILRDAMKTDPKTGRIDIQKLEKAIKWAQDNDFAWSPSVLTNKSPVPGLIEAIVNWKVESNYTPGMEFVGDKMFHSYMEDLIRFYLDEEPILKNPRTERFFTEKKIGKLKYDEDLINEVMKNQDKWVIKIVDGRGGDGIYIGPKMKKQDWKALEETIRRDPQRYVAQEYRHPSVLDDGHTKRIVDIRMFSYLHENGILVSRTPWARSTVMAGGDGKVNMSAGHGTETVVLIVPTPEECKNSFRKSANKKSKIK